MAPTAWGSAARFSNGAALAGCGGDGVARALRPGSMKSIVITGAAGFIGGHACALFQRHGWRVIGTDSREPVWPAGDSFHRCDLLDREGLRALARQINPAVILHLGAATRVAGCAGRTMRSMWQGWITSSPPWRLRPRASE
jgi:NAD(P)-dependent dehydrogenase (short-subunit alcohol dehydrogenase family)